MMITKLKHKLALIASFIQALARAIIFIWFILFVYIGSIVIINGQKELGEGIKLIFLVFLGVFFGLSIIGTILCFIIKCDYCKRLALVIKNNNDMHESYKAEFIDNRKWYEKDFNLIVLRSKEIHCCHCNKSI